MDLLLCQVKTAHIRTGLDADGLLISPPQREPGGTHRLVSDEVVFDGQPAIVLLDPVDLEAVAPVVEPGFQFGGAGFPYTCKNNEQWLAENPEMWIILTLTAISSVG